MCIPALRRFFCRLRRAFFRLCAGGFIRLRRAFPGRPGCRIHGAAAHRDRGQRD